MVVGPANVAGSVARIASDVSVMITVVMVAVHWIQLHDTMLVRPNNKAANGTAQCLEVNGQTNSSYWSLLLNR